MNIFIDTEDMEERYGEELYKEYLERENKELHNKIDKLTNNLENSIESINVKLSDKEIRIKDGIIVNPICEFRSVRLKAIRMKCEELLEILKDSE